MILKCSVCNRILTYASIQPHIIACYARRHGFNVQDASFNPKYSWAISYHLNTKAVVVAKHQSVCIQPYSTVLRSTGTIYWDSFVDVLHFVEADIEEKCAYV